MTRQEIMTERYGYQNLLMVPVEKTDEMIGTAIKIVEPPDET